MMANTAADGLCGAQIALFPLELRFVAVALADVAERRDAAEHASVPIAGQTRRKLGLEPCTGLAHQHQHEGSAFTARHPVPKRGDLGERFGRPEPYGGAVDSALAGRSYGTRFVVLADGLATST